MAMTCPIELDTRKLREEIGSIYRATLRTHPVISTSCQIERDNFV
jgi:hypothetical protein